MFYVKELHRKCYVVMYRVFFSLYPCSYPCEWGGVVDGKAYIKALEDFAKAVMEDLWSAIQKLFVEVRHQIILL